MADIGFGTAQSGGGQHIDVSSGSGVTVHTVPADEIHNITITAFADGAETFTTKVDGESGGVAEDVDANRQRVVFAGVVGQASSTTAVTVTTTATATNSKVRVKAVKQ